MPHDNEFDLYVFVNKLIQIINNKKQNRRLVGKKFNCVSNFTLI